MWGIGFQEAPCAMELTGGWFYTTANVKPVTGKKLSVQNFQVGHIMLNEAPSNIIQNYT